MDTPSAHELRTWSAALTLGPLDPDAPGETRYVELADAGRAAVDELLATVELSYEPTTQLLSGPSGAGKTTELNRLRNDLARADYRAVVVDVTTYVNESSPVDITEFLVALALGAHDVLVPAEARTEDGGFGVRLARLLSRLKVTSEILGVKAEVGADKVAVGTLGTTVELDLKRELKSSEPMVAELRSKLTYHVGQLYDEVATFLATLVDAEDPGAGSVLIVDGLEKLRGTSENDHDVQESVQALFVSHAGKLRFGSHHLVYTVPTYLQFTAPGALPYDSRVLPVPVPHVRPRPGALDVGEPTAVGELVEVVGRRVPVDRLFADREQVVRLVQASGGHLRDLFTLLRQLVNLIRRASISLPVADEHIEEAIINVAHDFAQITAEQEDFLRRVAGGDGTVRPRDREVQLMARLLQNHMLLGHLNGQDWYEVHPLARRALGLP